MEVIHVHIVSEMTYTVSSGTLNSIIPYHTIPYHTCSLTLIWKFHFVCRLVFKVLFSIFLRPWPTAEIGFFYPRDVYVNPLFATATWLGGSLSSDAVICG